MIKRPTGLWRTRWAAIGAAVAVTLGAGGLFAVNAAGTPSSLVPISPVRVLDTRFDIGLTDAVVSDQPRLLKVTGTVPIVLPGNKPGTGSPVPAGATSIVANVTAVAPSTGGWVSVRPGTATGEPTTSNLNFSAGQIVPNSVTVELPLSGANTGQVQLYFKGESTTATADLLVDIVGYYTPGAAGPAGPKGDKGDKGDTGPRGFSAWDEIPSGQTVAGEMNHDVHTPNGSADTDEVFVPFGAMAPSQPTAVAYEDGTSFPGASAQCTGTWDAPSAPPGWVCIYPWGFDGVDATQSGSAVGLTTHGFIISLKPANQSGTDMWFRAIWAYTAP